MSSLFSLFFHGACHLSRKGNLDMLTGVTTTVKMIEIMQSMAEGEQASETARTRVQVLSELLM